VIEHTTASAVNENAALCLLSAPLVLTPLEILMKKLFVLLTAMFFALGAYAADAAKPAEAAPAASAAADAKPVKKAKVAKKKKTEKKEEAKKEKAPA
jgi:hypothetical protein